MKIITICPHCKGQDLAPINEKGDIIQCFDCGAYMKLQVKDDKECPNGSNVVDAAR